MTELIITTRLWPFSFFAQEVFILRLWKIFGAHLKESEREFVC